MNTNNKNEKYKYLILQKSSTIFTLGIHDAVQIVTPKRFVSQIIICILTRQSKTTNDSIGTTLIMQEYFRY